MGREENGAASIPAPGDRAGESRGGAAPGPRTRETVFEAEAGEARSPTPVRGGKGGEDVIKPDEILVWRRDTWGNYGQHDNLYTFVLDEDETTFKPIFDAKFGVTVKHINKDSRKSVHRYTYITTDEVKKLTVKVIKMVHDNASSSKREVTVRYYVVTESGELHQLEAQTNLRDSRGFFDVVDLGDRKLVVQKGVVGGLPHWPRGSGPAAGCSPATPGETGTEVRNYGNSEEGN